MSQDRKLRFQCLPGAHEAQSLQTLLLNGRSEITLPDENLPAGLVYNLFFNAIEQDVQLHFVLPQTLTRDLNQFFADAGLSCFIFSDAERSDKKSVLDKCSRILNSDKEPVDSSGSWKIFYEKLERRSYGDFVISQVAMGEKPLYAIMERYLHLKAHCPDDQLEQHLERSTFEFRTTEYWHIRGRIREAQSLYLPIFEELDQLKELHSVFVEMYRPEEAGVLIKDLINGFLSELSTIRSDLHTWLRNYRKQCLNDLSQFSMTLRDQAFSIAAEAADCLREEPDDQKWKWLGRGSTAKEIAQEDIANAYSGLLQRIRDKGLEQIFDLAVTDDLAMIHDQLSDLLKSFHKIRRQLKKHVDEHIGRLNFHNLQIEASRPQIEEIQSRLQSFLREINGKQLFTKFWEDNTLDIVSRKNWLDERQQKLNRALEQAEFLEDYLKYKQFVMLIEEKDMAVLEALKNYEVEEWLNRFDLWYYENYIEAQDLIPLDYNRATHDLLRFSHAIFESGFQNTLKKIEQGLKERLKTFFKKNRKFKSWLEGSGDLEKKLVDLYMNGLKDLFPVTVDEPGQPFKYEKKKEFWLITFDEDLLRSGGLLLRKPHSTSDIPGPLYPPAVKQKVIHSMHSDRMLDIKKIASFILDWAGNFEIWQDQKQVYFSFADSGAQDILYNSLDQSYRRIKVNTSERMEDVIESMINNKNRHFYAIFTQRKDWCERNWSFQLEKLRMFRFLQHTGFTPLFISWHAIFENAELIAFLESERIEQKAEPALQASKD
ncbi:MAG: hypothetical protein R3275_05340 [Saprospiraceae bacterium]|nr:hypothetical protein [Saprospiraceae bacterium]